MPIRLQLLDFTANWSIQDTKCLLFPCILYFAAVTWLLQENMVHRCTRTVMSLLHVVIFKVWSHCTLKTCSWSDQVAGSLVLLISGRVCPLQVAHQTASALLLCWQFSVTSTNIRKQVSITASYDSRWHFQQWYIQFAFIMNDKDKSLCWKAWKQPMFSKQTNYMTQNTSSWFID